MDSKALPDALHRLSEAHKNNPLSSDRQDWKTIKPLKIDTSRELGIGNLCMGRMPLAKEPLNEEDWAEVLRTYLAFQHHLKLIVLNARKRQEITDPV